MDTQIRLPTISFLVFVIFLASCAPSSNAIQTAIAKTQIAYPIDTLAPAITSTMTSTLEPMFTNLPVATQTPNARPIVYSELVFEDPTTWPDNIKNDFHPNGVFSIIEYDNKLSTMWAELLQIEEAKLGALKPNDRLEMVRKYAQANGKIEVAIPSTWRDAVISSDENLIKIILQRSGYAPGFIDDVHKSSPPEQYLMNSNPYDWGNYMAEIGYDLIWGKIGNPYVPDVSKVATETYDESTLEVNPLLSWLPVAGKLALILYLPDVPANQAQEVIIQIQFDKYAIRRIQYSPIHVINSRLYYCTNGNFPVDGDFLSLCQDTISVGEQIFPTRIIQWNLPPEQKIDASYQLLQLLQGQYSDFLQLKLYSSGYFIAGVSVVLDMYVPNLPEGSDEQP